MVADNAKLRLSPKKYYRIFTVLHCGFYAIFLASPKANRHCEEAPSKSPPVGETF
jgi:hypothetical protein